LIPKALPLGCAVKLVETGDKAIEGKA
jgi:hypothetical protein